MVIHEIAHFYHEQAPFEHHLEVMNFFTNPASKTVKVGYYLFNEGLASAIGNGILEKRLREENSWEQYVNFPMSFYADSGIDTSGKAALKLTNKKIMANQAIDETYLSALDKLWSDSLKDIKNTPKERFRHAGMINLTGDTEGMGDELVNQLFGILQPSSAQFTDELDTTSENFMLTKYPSLDVLILATSFDQLKPLNLPGLDTSQKAAQGIQILTNEVGAVRVIVVSSSLDDVLEKVSELLTRKSF